MNYSIKVCLLSAAASDEKEPEVPVKRKRGRPPKNKPKAADTNQLESKDTVSNSTVTTKNVNNSSDITNPFDNNKSANGNNCTDITNSSDNIKSADADSEDEQKRVIDDDEEITDTAGKNVEENEEIENEIISPKKRGASRIIDEEDADNDVVDEKDNKDSKVLGKRNTGRGRPAKVKAQVKKEMSENEAKKIKEMAEMMKKKVEGQKQQLCEKQDKNLVQSDNNSTLHKSDAVTSKNPKQKTEGIAKSSTAPNTYSKTIPTMEHGTKNDINRPNNSGDNQVKANSEVTFGIDSILQNSSVFRPRADINKGSIIGNFAIIIQSCTVSEQKAVILID